MKKLYLFFLSAILLCCSAYPLLSAEGKPMNDGLYATISTNKGEIVLRLFYEKTPLTVINFIGLAEGAMHMTGGSKPSQKPFYNGLTFHRVIDNFMIQGGCPLGNGRGGPGYTFPDEIDPSLRHDGPGVLSMANAGPGTNGSQFFITHLPTPHLDGKHTVFGRVVKGQDVVNCIRQGDTIKSITIVRVGKAAEQFKADQAAFDETLAAIRAKENQKNRSAQDKMQKMIRERYPKAQRTASGLYYTINQKGEGETPAAGTTIRVHYTGRLLENNRKFDSSYDRNDPIAFPVGTGRVIAGWDEALGQMSKGEKRTLIIPPDLAYGARGAGGVIPPNAWLIFDVELIDF